MRIRVEKRCDDYIAYVDGNKGMYDCGKTRESAIGNLIITWGKTNGVVVLDENNIELVVEDLQPEIVHVLAANSATTWYTDDHHVVLLPTLTKRIVINIEDHHKRKNSQKTLYVLHKTNDILIQTDTTLRVLTVKEREQWLGWNQSTIEK